MCSRIRFRLSRFFILTLIIPIAFSCTQSEGYGGTSNIKGILMTKYYNDDYSMLIREEASVDEEVFIMFGEYDLMGDRVFTSPTGNFEFSFLNGGDYRLYYMGEDSTTVSDENVTQIIDVELADGKTIDLGTIYRIKTLDFDDGSAKIGGFVSVKNYKNDTFWPFLELKDSTLAQEQEVYLIYGDHEYYDERIRTNYDGYYEFTKLIPGEYKVFVYSEDIKGGTEDIPIIESVTITTEGEEVMVDHITIERL